MLFNQYNVKCANIIRVNDQNDIDTMLCVNVILERGFVALNFDHTYYGKRDSVA